MHAVPWIGAMIVVFWFASYAFVTLDNQYLGFGLVVVGLFCMGEFVACVIEAVKDLQRKGGTDD